MTWRRHSVQSQDGGSDVGRTATPGSVQSHNPSLSGFTRHIKHIYYFKETCLILFLAKNQRRSCTTLRFGQINKNQEKEKCFVF